MKKSDSRWSKFISWILCLSALYGFSGLWIGVPRPHFGLVAALAILLGWASAIINAAWDTKELSDNMMAPTILGLLAVIVALVFHNPQVGSAVAFVAFIAGYVAGAPAFGETLATLFRDRVLPLILLPAILVALEIDGGGDWMKKNWTGIAEALYTILYFASIAAWLVGWAIPNSTFLALGLGSFAGITISAQTTKRARGQTILFCILLAVTAVLWLCRRFTSQPHEFLIGAISLIVALYVAHQNDREPMAAPPPALEPIVDD